MDSLLLVIASLLGFLLLLRFIIKFSKFLLVVGLIVFVVLMYFLFFTPQL